MRTLTIQDETAAGDILHKISLQFQEEYISVEQLIEARIRNEVAKYESDSEAYINGLVAPTKLEKRLNQKSRKNIDVEKQLYIALEAFKNNGFILLLDDEQIDSLSQKFLVDENTQISFIKLTPLVGG